jgi:hypothetical protein
LIGGREEFGIVGEGCVEVDAREEKGGGLGIVCEDCGVRGVSADRDGRRSRGDGEVPVRQVDGEHT